MNDWAEFRHFKYLLAILEHGGLRAAAEHLRTAEPNLSVQAKQFQEYFSVELYRKSKDGRILLTETGVAFKPIAQGLLDARDEAIAALLAIEHREVRTLNIGCAPFVDPELFHAACEMHREIVPNCPIRPTHGDTVQLVEELISGEIDAAIMTLPISDPRLCIKEIRRDRLVACLRADHPLANKAALRPSDLHGNLSVLHHPQRYPEGHAHLLEMLGKGGVQIGRFSRASHPAEMQELVKGGYGFALIREGTALDAELTTRPIAGVDWTVDTAFAYQKQLHPKTIPILARHLKKRLPALPNNGRTPQTTTVRKTKNGSTKRPPRSEDGGRNESSCWLPEKKSA